MALKSSDPSGGWPHRCPAVLFKDELRKYRGGVEPHVLAPDAPVGKFADVQQPESHGAVFAFQSQGPSCGDGAVECLVDDQIFSVVTA